MGGVDGVCAAEDIGRLSFTRRPAHGLCTFWRPRLDLSGMKALHPGRGLLMYCTPRVLGLAACQPSLSGTACHAGETAVQALG